MTTPTSNAEKRKIMAAWVMIVIAAILSLVIPEYLTLTKESRIKAYKSSEALIHEVEHIISQNNEDRYELEAFLKQTYSGKAQAASFIIDSTPGMIDDPLQLAELAKLLEVDQINIINGIGTIYSGSVPDYYGLSFDSGPQMAYFKPMLRDQKLSMSQALMPNTAENKPMMYSICWNAAETHMVQVGVNGERFPAILSNNQLESVIGQIPGGQGTDIILTKFGSNTIRAATTHSLLDRNLEDIGVILPPINSNSRIEVDTGFRDNPIYCSVQPYKGYEIIILQYKNIIDKTIPFTIVTFAEYLAMVFIVMSFVLDYLYTKFLQERTYALKDRLTGMNNRRDYEDVLAKYDNKELEDNLIFVSMDVNGLKKVNDELGHDTGDALLKGAASCITKCFDTYGTSFRVGGDEFAAIIFADQKAFEGIQQDFEAAARSWSESSGISLFISVGSVRKSSHPDMNIRQLAKAADKAMYDAKNEFYKQSHWDRRKV